MDPNASIGRDGDRNNAVRSPTSMGPSAASALLPPPAAADPPPRRRGDQGDSGGRVSRRRTSDADDDDVTLQSVISQSGERSVQMPREGAGITHYNLAYEGPDGDVEQEAKQEDSPDAPEVRSDDVTMMYLPTDVTEAARGTKPSQAITEGKRGRRARFRLELASPREPDEDMFVSREVSGEASGSNPLPVQAVAPQGGERREQRSMPPFGSQPGYNLELAPAREQGPEDLAGCRGAVLPEVTVEEHPHDGANQHDTFQVHSQRIAPTPLVEDEQQEFTVEEDEPVAQPGAYHVDGIHARHDATEEDTIWGGVDSGNEDGAVREDHEDDDLFSAQLVDPEADRLQLYREVKMHVQHEAQMQVQRQVQLELEIHELRAQQDRSDKACCTAAGFDFSKRTNQAICLLVLALGVASLLAALFASNVVGPQSSSSAGATSPTPNPTPSPTPNPTPNPTPSPTPNPTPFLSPLPVTPAPIFAPGHVAQWVQVGNDIDGENPGDESGRSVALSSNGAVVAIGARLNDGGAGHVRVYINAGGGWNQRGSDLDGSVAGDDFGWSLSLSANGTILAVGARLADGVNGVKSGRVHVFQWISNTWQPMGSTLDGEAALDEFGNSLALSDDGTILAVGAWVNDAGGITAGHVRAFAWTGTDWTQQGNDLLGSIAGDQFGNSVSLSSDGSILACGGDQFHNSGPGYARIYRWSGSAWQQQGSAPMGFSSNDDFGVSVSLSGDGSIVAAGTWRGSYVVVYRNDGTDWVQIGQTIRGETSDDRFGYSISLAFDGKTILIGGYLNDSNGISSGHALVFRLSPNEQEWIQVGQELIGEAASDNFGWSTAISDSGTRISIGAFGNVGINGDRAGHVRVYDLQ